MKSIAAPHTDAITKIKKNELNSKLVHQLLYLDEPEQKSNQSPPFAIVRTRMIAKTIIPIHPMSNISYSARFILPSLSHQNKMGVKQSAN